MWMRAYMDSLCTAHVCKLFFCAPDPHMSWNANVMTLRAYRSLASICARVRAATRAQQLWTRIAKCDSRCMYVCTYRNIYMYIYIYTCIYANAHVDVHASALAMHLLFDYHPHKEP